jgi:uncharacterized protein YecE (DUF72 family)
MMAALAQLPLFEIEPVRDPAVVAVAGALSRRLFLGTTSWTYPGWADLVYRGAPGLDELIARGLHAYARHPLFRTVSIDRSYYQPLTSAAWRAYREQLPAGFKATAKMWSEITRRTFANHPKLGALAGRPNPRWLDVTAASGFIRDYLDGMADAAGPLLLQFPPLAAPNSAVFCAELAAFLKALPAGAYAVEIRNRELFTPRYARTLRECGAAHTFTWWSAMPELDDQIAVPELLDAPFVMARLNLPPGTAFAERRDSLSPFDRIVTPQPSMRAAVCRLWERARERDLDCYLIADNKAEGCAPLTLLEIAKSIAAR